jgi:acetylornithine/succinyldiaminopimelate/putrescine aminotransferase
VSPIGQPAETGPAEAARLRIARAENDLLIDEDGRAYIDLHSGHGAAWLGHANSRIAAGIVEQLHKVWITGGLETPVHAEARALVESYFPATHRLATFYSTGMEAAEFALRVARVVHGGKGAVGFEGSMHGKSLATAYLGWDNHDAVVLPGFRRVAFVDHCPESEILEELEGALASGSVSAVFVEPLQGCGGGHAATPRFYRQVSRLCADRQVLLVFDEILTGFHRTGPAFYFSRLGFVPDVILIGKALGNGFPVSGVIVDRKYRIGKEMLPGSTFSGNPLAAAAVVSTLQQARALDLPARVARIEHVIATELAPVEDRGIALRGLGALWTLDVPQALDLDEIVVGLFRSGVAVGYAGRILRVLPAATIELEHLRKGCSLIRAALLRTSDGRHGCT